MRIETKQVTIEREVYIAEDGTEFFDEDECIEYEIRHYEKTIEMYDDTFARCDNIDECLYVKINAPEDVETLTEVLDHYGYVTKVYPVNPGVYMWYDGEFTNLTEIIEKLGGETK